jgi:hypothetical protein
MARGQYTKVGQHGHGGGGHGGSGGGRGGWGGGGRSFFGGGFGGFGYPYGYGFGGLGGYGYPYLYGYDSSPYSYARPYYDISPDGYAYDTGDYYLTSPSYGGFGGWGGYGYPHWRSRWSNRQRVSYILGRS